MKYVLLKGGSTMKTEFAIKNEYGETVLKVEASKFSLRKRISIRDQYGIEIGHIQKKLLAPGLVYEIFHESELQAVLKRRRWFFSRFFEIKTTGGAKYRVRGQYKKLDYAIFLKGRKAAVISPQLALRSENYGIEVADFASAYICICAALIIEAVHGIYGKGK